MNKKGHSIIFLFLNVIFLIAITFSISSAQSGFKQSIALQLDEPNGAHHVAELNQDTFIVSGQYFDQSLGHWTVHASIVNHKGDLLHTSTHRTDDIIGPDISNISFIYDNKYWFMAVGIENSRFASKILNYSPKTKDVSTFNSFQGFAGRSFFIENDSTFYTGGFEFTENSIENALVYKLCGSDTILYRFPSETKNQRVLNILVSSDGKFVVACTDKILMQDRSQDSTFFLFLDKNLNLIKSTYNESGKVPFRLQRGMTIDHLDNIVCTGSKQLPTETTLDQLNVQGLVKFDPEGNHLWTTFIGNSINNESGWGKWHSVVESSQKDGYIIAGSESYQDLEQDTFMAKAAIAKVSYEGDSLWMHSYSYRQGTKLIERFNDVIATSDGGYLAVGAGTDFSIEVVDLPATQSILLKVNKDGLLDTTTSAAIIPIDKDDPINIFPNPTQGPLYLTQTLNQKLYISIYNQSGQKVDNYTSDHAQHTIVMNVADYPSGIYTLIADNKKGKRFTRRFVVE